ncbi:hypothetical protein E3O42_04515 [Cryobacterium adonitolivorans]|uniref:Uncharacterized protein n=1 Tax=Cryobacterium adonitolivorans TaxID=1259189 RepID=A0A4R8W8H1_9MICO|nr:hypothetical protein [Cryobacterium adonitolivorans]TFC04768.1 hypothetical protein E3O42_04515 [Cryobacterium adonitolivorans]
MNTQLAPVPGRHDHPPQSVRSPETHPVRRVGLVDRAVMHLGIALIRWGRRPVKARRGVRPTLAPESIAASRELDRVRDEYLALKLTQFR